MGVVIRQSIKGIIVTYAGAFIGFLIQFFIITRFLSPEDIGLTSVIIEIGILFAVLCQLGTSSSIIRYFPYFRNREHTHGGFFFYIVALPVVGSLVFVPLYLLFKQPIIDFLAKSSPAFTGYFYWIIPLILFLTYLQVFETYSTVNRRIVVPKFNREVLVRLLMLAVYLLYGYHFINRSGLILGMIAVYGLVLLAAFVYVCRIAPVSMRYRPIPPALGKEMLRYTAYLVAGALGGTILAKLDLFMISSEMGYNYSGIFRIATYMAVIVEIPSRSIAAISAPLAAEALKNGDFATSNTLYQKVSLHQLLAGGMIFLLLWVNIDTIFALLPNGALYAGGKWVVFFLGMAKLTEVTLNFGGQLISFSKYYYWNLYFVFFIIGIGILTNLWLIPHLGITGAAVATALTTLLSYSVQQWIVLKKVKGNPYTKSTLKVLLLFALLIGLNSSGFRLQNPWADGLLRSAVTLFAGALLIYYGRISEEINRLVDRFFEKAKKSL
ncbi:MAG: oligosaccharide flippase family protein [Culturomica sp.]|jgi:O-antigen/teichoic acid export membrane protein|nr:oligosaccharide flippase family protein [Culturomica sp.]